ncbi:hypothetical protein CIK05_13225 [Bdellovibrio sp. qaytius]|nr:hypothetical protein CIK05_13225 [Bdellovibrio sp. qaytius]
MNFSESLNMINECIEPQTNVFVDAGNTGAFALNQLSLHGQSICYVSLAMGGMGNSIGVAMGAAFTSGKKSLVILGDGSFLMYGLEIHTAIEHHLPLVVIIFNNNSHGMCSTRETVFMGQETGLNNFNKSFFAAGLKLMFPLLPAFEVNSSADLQQSLKILSNLKGPAVLSINLLTNENPPFVAFKKKESNEPAKSR